MLLPALLVGACDDDDDDELDTVGEPRPDGGQRPDAGPGQADAGMERPDADTGAPVTEVACPGDAAVQVDMDELQFRPASADVSGGEVVMWTNNDTVPHTVTSGNPGDANAGVLFDSGTLNPGDSYCLRFDRADDYEYYCEIHPAQMDDGLVTAR